MIQGEVLHLSDFSFGDLVLTQDGFILVDFYDVSSLDCQRQGVIIEDLAEKYKKRIKMAKLDVDKNPGITSRYRVTEVPTLILFRNGEEVDRLTGFISESELVSYLDQKLKENLPKSLTRVKGKE